MKKILLLLTMFLIYAGVSAQQNPSFNSIRTNQVKELVANGGVTYTGAIKQGDTLFYADGSFQIYSAGLIFPFPDSFSYRPPFHVLNDPSGGYFIDPSFDLRQYAAIEGTGTAYYVNVETGSDANPGTSAVSPLKSLGAALQKTDVSTVYLASGYYYDRYSWRGLVPTRSIEIIGTGDSVIISSDFRDVLTFTLEGNLYKAFTDTVPSGLWDRLQTDQFGDAKSLALYTSRAQVDTATVGAYYYATDTIFLRLEDFRAPDSFVSVFSAGFNTKMIGEGLKYYFKNVYLYGGALYSTNSTGGNGGVRIYADSVHTRGGSNTFDGTYEVFLFNSSFAKVKNTDIINYDPENGVIPTFVEYNCNVYNTMDLGYTPGGSDQASTAHNGSRGIRLNSTYKYTVGQCVADVNGCESWLVACTADSAITTGSANYVFGTGADFGRAWLQDCESYNRPPSGYDVNSQALAVTHLNGFVSDNYDFGTTGEIDSNYTFRLYDPLEFQMVHTMMGPHLLNLTTVGTDGQTIRYSGTTPVANSFLYNSGSAIGVGTATPGYDVEIFGDANGGDATFGIKTAINGVATTITLEGTGSDWTVGAQNNLNSGALIFTTSSLGSANADMVLATNGNMALSSTDVSTDKLNVNGTIRSASLPATTTHEDSLLIRIAGANGRFGSMAFKQGVYLPVDSAGSNVDGVTPDTAFYTRSGNIVTVSGVVEIDPTTTLTPTFFYMNVPVFPANWNTNRAGGTFAAYIVNESGGIIMGGPTSVVFQFNPTATGANIFSYTYSYRIQ